MPDVYFIGEILSATQFPSNLSLFVSYSIHPSSPTWRHTSGESQGRTWLTSTDTSLPTPAHIFNQVIDSAYTCSDVRGWPSILIQVYSTDMYGRVDIIGYGVCRLPVQSGLHSRKIYCFRPRGTYYEYITSFFIGGTPRYTYPISLLPSDKNTSRYGHGTVSTGIVNINLSVVHSLFDRFPYVQLEKSNSQNEVNEGGIGGVWKGSKRNSNQKNNQKEIKQGSISSGKEQSSDKEIVDEKADSITKRSVFDMAKVQEDVRKRMEDRKERKDKLAETNHPNESTTVIKSPIEESKTNEEGDEQTI